MTSYPGPLVCRVLLLSELRALCHGAGLRDADLAGRLGRTSAEVTAVLYRAPARSEGEFHDVLNALDVPGDVRERLLELRAKAGEPGWWEPFHADLDDAAFLEYLAYENAADAVGSVECQWVPGLLQTASYARAVLRLFRPDAPDAQIDALVRLRLERQRLLSREDAGQDAPPAWQTHLIDEAALRRRIGSDEIVAEQLDHLLDASLLPNVSIRVLPMESGYAGVHGPFLLAESRWAVADALHLERSPRSTTITGIASPEIVAHRGIFADLQAAALDEDASRTLIRTLRDTPST
ncbi:helix-turn-helix domain-containing protein [Actinomadura rupiterrae]|uniref:helix-turn-helix domain-containing protein n=1 Tax=Actinomadura rupiterrae TaxID=559627 RepID=UPI0020A60FD3|nr:helix-turn-helix transcriptional regulator [Actinomadura rupiterrae]MCP2337454.1 hypothetical protein [Actinomadura rupiterrae]